MYVSKRNIPYKGFCRTSKAKYGLQFVICIGLYLNDDVDGGDDDQKVEQGKRQF